MDYIAFDTKHLACLSKNPMVSSIEKVFNEISTTKKNCPQCQYLFLGSSYFSNLYNRNYLALGIKKNDFGGYNVFVLFENEPSLFQLWLYPTDNEIYQLREIEVEDLSKHETNKMIQYSKESKYSKYWHHVAKKR
jgi:hypothetical protein